jgi:PleD family two-component response regulator
MRDEADQAAAALSDAVRLRLYDQALNHARIASIGVALVSRPHRRRITELFAEADIALYDAKAAGRNKVHLIGDGGCSRAA